MPDETSEPDLKHLLELLLHEVRTPVSIAQGYLRLLMEDRLSDGEERQRAIERSMDAIGRISTICLNADDYLNETASPLSPYPAADLIAAIRTEVAKHKMTVSMHHNPIPGDVSFPPATEGAGDLVAILRTFLSRHPTAPRAVHISVQEGELVLTVGDQEGHERLLQAGGGSPVNPWRGGNGLAAPLALRRLAHTGLRTWILATASGCLAVALPLRLAA